MDTPGCDSNHCEPGLAPAPSYLDLETKLAAAESRVKELEALVLDVWDAWHREGHEPTETIGAVIDRIGDWRWNNGYDPFNPPVRQDPRAALAGCRP